MEIDDSDAEQFIDEQTRDDVAELCALVAVAAEQSVSGASQPWNADDFKRRLREYLTRAKGC